MIVIIMTLFTCASQIPFQVHTKMPFLMQTVWSLRPTVPIPPNAQTEKQKNWPFLPITVSMLHKRWRYHSMVNLSIRLPCDYRNELRVMLSCLHSLFVLLLTQQCMYTWIWYHTALHLFQPIGERKAFWSNIGFSASYYFKSEFGIFIALSHLQLTAYNAF